MHEAIEDVRTPQRIIGTLGEKTLHAALKRYYEGDNAKHEMPIGSYVADISNEYGITEIQTGAFNKLRSKLTEFLNISPVRVVYPLPKTKWLLWIDESTGETTKKRKSPKQGSIHDAFFELYKIKPFLTHPNFRLCIVMLNMEEYRYLNGWSVDKKRGSTRCDRIPVEIVEEVNFRTLRDYKQFIPDGLHEGFTSKEYGKAINRNIRTAQTALNILHHVGVVKRTGKQGDLFVYERT